MTRWRWSALLTSLTLFFASPVFFASPAAAKDNAEAARFVFTGPCAELNTEVWRSEACDAFMAAHPHPVFEPAVGYDPKRDNKAHSRAIYLPDEAPPFPLAWMKRNWYFMDGPGVKPAKDDWTNKRFVERYNMFYLYQAVEIDNIVWYLIGPGQWMKDEFLAVLHIPTRPEKVLGRWVMIDESQQILVAMQDDTPVWATLIASGDWFTWTSLGLFQVYARAEALQLSGPPGVEPPKYDFRSNWLLFFDDQQAIHSVNDHNLFGYPASYGCINMVPGDAKWLWDFLNVNGDEWDADLKSFLVDVPEKAPYVYIYRSPRFPESIAW